MATIFISILFFLISYIFFIDYLGAVITFNCILLGFAGLFFIVGLSDMITLIIESICNESNESNEKCRKIYLKIDVFLILLGIIFACLFIAI